MEIINTPISSELISSFKLRRQWDLTKQQDTQKSIAREDNPKVLSTLIEEYDETRGTLAVWTIIYNRLKVSVAAGMDHTEYARLSVYAYATNFILGSDDSESFYYTKGASYALLESYSLLRLVP